MPLAILEISFVDQVSFVRKHLAVPMPYIILPLTLVPLGTILIIENPRPLSLAVDKLSLVAARVSLDRITAMPIPDAADNTPLEVITILVIDTQTFLI